jgi:CHASE3 domain sensor protein
VTAQRRATPADLDLVSRDPTAPAVGIVEELERNHRAVVVTICLMLVLNVVSSAYLLFVRQPKVALYTELAHTSVQAHEAMLDEETGLRGWLATGDRVLRTPYDDGRRLVDDVSSRLVE